MSTYSTRAQRGKDFEKYVASQFQILDKYAYRRRDSGSGKLRKEDVFTTLPFFIECKNQKTQSLGAWYKKAELDTPKNKYTLLIYKTERQRGATVYMKSRVFLSIISGVRVDEGLEYPITMNLSHFISLLKEKNDIYT